MRLGLRLEQTLSLDLKEELLLRLQNTLTLRIGALEKQILEKVDFVDIDLSDEDAEYHVDMLRELIVKESEEEYSLIGQILSESELAIEDVEKVVVESFEQADISFAIGTKRNVDRIHIVLKNGQEAVMTVSLDLDPHERIEDSPSYQEKTVLEKIDPGKVWSLQRYYGGRTVPLEGEQKKFLICKEFVPGDMLANYLDGEGDTELKTKLASATGKMIANTLAELGGVVADSNPLNIIIAETNGEVIARYCDTERVEHDPQSIALEIQRLGSDFKECEPVFLKSISDHYKGRLFE